MRKIKIILFVFALYGSTNMSANIAPFRSIIDSLAFTSNSWTISLSSCYYQNGFYKNSTVDSIIFSNHVDSTKVKQGVIDAIRQLNNQYSGYKIIADSLEKAILLNKTGDVLRVVVYGHYDSGKWHYNDSLLFGNEPNACVRAPRDGEFLSSKEFYGGDCGVSVCNSKTCYAIIKGCIFDKNGTPLQKKTFELFTPQGSFTTGDDGSFAVAVYAGSAQTISLLEQSDYSMLVDQTIYDYFSYPVVSFSFNANPGDTIAQDIHLLKDYATGSVEKVKPQSQYFCYPNPAHDVIQFSYSIVSNVPFQHCMLYVYDVTGKLMDKTAIPAQEGEMKHALDSRYAAGKYRYVVRNVTAVLYQGQFIVQ